MGVPSEEVLNSIPQKPPFLFVDKVVFQDETSIKTEFQVTGDEDFFKGHFPDNPIMPGVLLQEVCFQSGALFMAKKEKEALGVIGRVESVKFKNFVKPGDLLEVELKLIDQINNAFIMSGKIKVLGKTVVALKFTGALT